jgi:hypothetical protein
MNLSNGGNEYERNGGAPMLYALKSRNGSRRVANQIIVLPLEQPLLFIF